MKDIKRQSNQVKLFLELFNLHRDNNPDLTSTDPSKSVAFNLASNAPLKTESFKAIADGLNIKRYTRNAISCHLARDGLTETTGPGKIRITKSGLEFLSRHGY